jgi:hypothetical protein
VTPEQPQQSVACEKCGTGMEGCFEAANGMRLKAWLCPACHWFCKAIGRERSIVKGEADGVQ